MNIDSILNTLEIDGVCLLKNIFTKNELKTIYNTAINIENNINKTLKTKDIPYSYYKYITLYDKEIIHHKKLYKIDNTDILEISNGLYDVNLETPNNSFNFKNDIIETIINKIIKKNYNSKVGLLTSSSKSDFGPWNRAVVNIDGDSDDNGNYNDYNMVHNMSPFYFTVLVPLVKLDKNNGSTEFIKGSHKLTYNEIKDKNIENKNIENIQFETEIGDIIIFDGRIFHRGCENKSDESRPIIYNIIYRDWYNET